ncbi:MAG TPA: hypothetical protein VFQ88_06390 [Nevskiaceae bacterium]|nr:hypothetical protein [Nevskiaceae bacterium]
MTAMFPNPFLSDTGRIERVPDWARLAVWDALRRRYLGLHPDARDRTASTFYHP